MIVVDVGEIRLIWAVMGKALVAVGQCGLAWSLWVPVGGHGRGQALQWVGYKSVWGGW